MLMGIGDFEGMLEAFKKLKHTRFRQIKLSKINNLYGPLRKATSRWLQVDHQPALKQPEICDRTRGAARSASPQGRI
jgi:hypothetical protein